jgi:hypothetical protein
MKPLSWKFPSDDLKFHAVYFHCFVGIETYEQFYLWIASIQDESIQGEPTLNNSISIWIVKRIGILAETPSTCLMSWSFTHYISLNKMTICCVSCISLLRWGFVVGGSQAGCVFNLLSLLHYLLKAPALKHML